MGKMLVFSRQVYISRISQALEISPAQFPFFFQDHFRPIKLRAHRSAVTVCAQIHSYDDQIDKVGYCLECRQLKGPYETEKTDKRIAKPDYH